MIIRILKETTDPHVQYEVYQKPGNQGPCGLIWTKDNNAWKHLITGEDTDDVTEMLCWIRNEPERDVVFLPNISQEVFNHQDFQITLKVLNQKYKLVILEFVELSPQWLNNISPNKMHLWLLKNRGLDEQNKKLLYYNIKCKTSEQEILGIIKLFEQMSQKKDQHWESRWDSISTQTNQASLIMMLEKRLTRN